MTADNWVSEWVIEWNKYVSMYICICFSVIGVCVCANQANEIENGIEKYEKWWKLKLE